MGEILNPSGNFPIEDIRVDGDSIKLTTTYFDSEFRGIIESGDLITGEWYKKSCDCSIPFIGEYNKEFLFSPKSSKTSLQNRYSISLFDQNDTIQVMGIFTITDSIIHGSIQTPTGDYGSFSGSAIGNMLYLSNFNGSQVYLLKAEIEGDKLVNGILYSGKSSSKRFEGLADNAIEPNNPYTVSLVKPGKEKIDFSFPNLQGDTVSWKDLNLEGRVVILSITGTWCPNCLDATNYFKSIQEKFGDNLVILPIAFEREESLTESIKKVQEYQKRHGSSFNYLIGGEASKKVASEKFPMLSGIHAFPTTIFIDKKGNIRQVHSGFSGPATGQIYESYKGETESFIQELLSE